MCAQYRSLFGTEIEWGTADMVLADIETPIGDFSPYVCFPHIRYDHLPSNLAHASQMLSNGARFYNDGGLLEYSSPEVTSLDEIVAAELVAEYITYLTLLNCQKAGTVESFSLHKRVIDDRKNTWGYHENYLCERGKIPHLSLTQLGLLAMHLATRNLFVGAGALVDGRFVLGQKATTLKSDFSESTTSNKPLINERDEYLAGPEWRRLHITSGDPNISPWATRLKIGSTALVVRMVAEGKIAGDLQPFPGTVHQLAKQVSEDLTFEKTFTLASREEIKPIDVQKRIIKLARNFLEHNGATDDEAWTIQAWEQAHKDFCKNPDLLRDRADWPRRRQLIERKLGTMGLEWAQIVPHSDESRELSSTDIGYDYISFAKRMIAQVFRTNNWAEWMPDEALVEARKTTPPQDTRAKYRGEQIQKGNVKYGDWHQLTLKNGDFVRMENPYVADAQLAA